LTDEPAPPEHPRMVDATPTLFDWAGGEPAFRRLFELFYQRVPADPLVGPVFAEMSSEHAAHVADFVIEVFGGPKHYSAMRGGHPNMVKKHLGRALSQTQRKRWVDLLLACADDVGMPADPEFRSAFVAYLEWGSRLAVINSQPGVEASEDAAMPAWGWGEPKGPYLG
jgi:hemoglobin